MLRFRRPARRIGDRRVPPVTRSPSLGAGVSRGLLGPRQARRRRSSASPDAGFDAVIGNPPWIRQETIQSDKAVLAAQFATVFDSVADIYVFFLARGLALLAPSRLIGMIVPNKWHRAAYGEKLRRLLSEHEQPVTLIDFGHAPVFPDADTFPCILIARNAQPRPW